jgi:hypothetical protein
MVGQVVQKVLALWYLVRLLRSHGAGLCDGAKVNGVDAFGKTAGAPGKEDKTGS